MLKKIFLSKTAKVIYGILFIANTFAITLIMAVWSWLMLTWVIIVAVCKFTILPEIKIKWVKKK